MIRKLTTTKIVLLMIAAIVISSCGVRSTKQIVILYDQSKSKIDGCECLTSVLDQTLRENLSEGVKITFFKLGDPKTGFEPRVVDVYELPRNRKVTEGKGESLEKLATIVNEFRSKCGAIERSDQTPLTFAVSKVIGFLRQNGCGDTLGCDLIIQSDLQDSYEETLTRKNRSKEPLQTKLENAGINVTFFGVSEVQESVRSERDRKVGSISKAMMRDNLKESWRQKFTDPTSVLFYDFCAFDSQALINQTGLSESKL